jgi:hypothetical protein
VSGESSIYFRMFRFQVELLPLEYRRFDVLILKLKGIAHIRRKLKFHSNSSPKNAEATFESSIILTSLSLSCVNRIKKVKYRDF